MSSFLRKKLDILTKYVSLWTMNLTKKITQQIKRIPEDTSFGYDQLKIEKAQYVSAAKVLERLQKKGIIKKISKGTFYKPKISVFGEMKPNEQEILKPYLFFNGKRVAYITGDYLYNQLGLTTQISGKLNIASRNKRIYVSTKAIKATPVKSYADVTDDNFQLLGFLDAIKDLKTIPDVELKSAITIFSNRIKKLDEKQQKDFIQYTLLYPPRVKAIAGAILEKLKEEKYLKKLKENINPLTNFKIGITNKILSTATNWNIE